VSTNPTDHDAGDTNAQRPEVQADGVSVVEAAIRAALGQHDQPDHTVAELIIDLVRQVDTLRADDDAIRTALSDHIGERMPAEMPLPEGLLPLFDEIAGLTKAADWLEEQERAVRGERDQLARELEELRPLHRMASDQAQEFQDLLREITPHMNWRFVTAQLTPEQREVWAEVIEAGADEHAPVEADRWWLDNTPAEHPDCTRTGMCQERHNHAPECLSQFRTDAERANGVYPDDAELATRRSVYEAATPTDSVCTSQLGCLAPQHTVDCLSLRLRANVLLATQPPAGDQPEEAQP
jgi:hypothetical protein